MDYLNHWASLNVKMSGRVYLGGSWDTMNLDWKDHSFLYFGQVIITIFQGYKF